MIRKTRPPYFIFARTPPYANIRVPLPVRGSQEAMGVGRSARITASGFLDEVGEFASFRGEPLWRRGNNSLPRSVAH